MLSRGGSVSPEELGRVVGIDVNDPKFWEGGLLLIEEGLRDTEAAAAAAGRITATPGPAGRT
jgi:oligoendopeptidase F